MSDSVVSKFGIKLMPIDDMLGRCDDVFGPMLRCGAKYLIQHTDFDAVIDRPPAAITLSVVTPPERFNYRYLEEWLYEHGARGGTLAELCAWVEQYPDRVSRFRETLATGTIMQDGIEHRTPMSMIPFSRQSNELTYLEIRQINAPWRSGASFLAVLDTDNPFS